MIRLPKLDKLGVVVALAIVVGTGALPFVVSRPNRIVPGAALGIGEALPLQWAVVLIAVLALGTILAVFRVPNLWRLCSTLLSIVTLGLMLGVSASTLTPEGNIVARVSPAAGFWLLMLAYWLVATDALVRLRLRPLERIGALALTALAIAAMLWGGVWQDVSILREYANRGTVFWSEAGTHVALVFGSLMAACLLAIPLGIACYRNRTLRTGVLNVLNVVQTVPSMALFGLLIAPLAWVAANVPGAALLGISGIGFAPAIIALFGYSLLPLVANTVSGLEATPPAVKEAARGMGMTDRQILLEAELPLALPIIVTGIRIVLVQNIGLATIAGLIGGGGLGVFVFQGIGQTAMDLVLLGAVPTVALALGAAVLLDSLVEMMTPGKVPAR